MSEQPSYSSALGVESAIKSAATRAAADDPRLDVSKRINIEYFTRFLSRVFSEGEDSPWVLKGGTGMLARVPGARDTRDIDLLRTDSQLDEALRDLIRLAAVDLGDHFRFEYAGHSPVIGTDTQPYVDGYRVRFDVFLGVRPKGRIGIDLVVGTTVTGLVPRQVPATRLDLPRLVSHPYRLYPVEDQIADKVCAMMTAFSGSASSREKDLVDLVVLASTHRIDGSQLRVAIATEAARRRMSIERLVVPATWGAGYSRLSRTVQHCAEYATVERATELASALIDPAVRGAADGLTWSYETKTWR